MSLKRLFACAIAVVLLNGKSGPMSSVNSAFQIEHFPIGVRVCFWK